MPSKTLLANLEDIDALRSVTTKALALAMEEATAEWKNDLQALFHDAKNRFPDIVWGTADEKEAVWGHKAIVYARNEKTLLGLDDDDEDTVTDPPNRAFNVKFRPSRPPTRTFNLVQERVHRTGLDERYPPRKDSLRSLVFASTKPDEERKTTVVETTLSQADLVKEILSLYTVEDGPQGAESHLTAHPPITDTDSDNKNQHDSRLKLFRQDLMIGLYRENLTALWKAQMHTDIQVNVRWFGQEAINHRETSLYRFPAHRCILASRSPVLRNVLMGKPGQNPLFTSKTTDKGLVEMTLPYPPVTPSSFYRVLGYMYSGTIYFRTHRPDRLSNLALVFPMIRSAILLGMPTLQKLLVAHIVVKIVHGLFHAYLTNAEYVRLVGSSWSGMRKAGGGCRCADCVARVPRVLQFALGSNVHSYVLQRGARRALVGTFGLGWCSREFASVPRNVRVSVLTSVLKMVTPENALALLLAAQEGLDGLDTAETKPAWDVIVRAMTMVVRDSVDEVMCRESRACFDSEEWRSVISMDTPRRKYELELIMMAVLRATQAKQSLYITAVYQTFDSLEIPDTPGNFFVRAIVEHIKCELLSNMAPMLSRSAVSLSTHVSFATAEEGFVEGSSSQSHRAPSIISTKSGRRLRTQSSASSIYSELSYQTVPWSITESYLDATSPWSLDGAEDEPNTSPAADVEWDDVDDIDSRSEMSRMLALDLAEPSTYSCASSRTLSTDYGLFYTRRAIWSTSTFSLRRGVRRRNSWDSLISVA